MAGDLKAVFDSNIVIDALNGHVQADIEYGKYESVFISVITWIEVMVGEEDTDGDTSSFLAEKFIIVPVTDAIAIKSVQLRRQCRIKLPDAIILATAHVQESLLVTRNTRDFPEKTIGVHVPYTI